MVQPLGPVPAVPAPPAPRPSAPVGADDVSAVLSGPAFEAVVSILGELPLLHSSYSDALPARSTYKSLDAQPVHSLLDEANCLLRAITDEVVPHMRAALSIPHPLSSFSLTHEAADLLQAVDHVSGFHGDPVGLSSERHAMRSVLARASAAARPLSARLHDLMAPSVRQVAGGLNVALLAAMGSSIGFPDTSLAENFVRGFPVCGFVPVSDSPNFRAVPRDPDFPDIDGLYHVTHNSRMAARVVEDFSAGRSPHARVLWDGSVGEVAKGYSQGPFSFAAVNERFGSGNWRAMHAFAVEQVNPTAPSSTAGATMLPAACTMRVPPSARLSPVTPPTSRPALRRSSPTALASVARGACWAALRTLRWRTAAVRAAPRASPS